jgi:hypothetical protein
MRLDAVERVSLAGAALVAMEKICPICLPQVRRKTQKAARFHKKTAASASYETSTDPCVGSAARRRVLFRKVVVMGAI